jgi:hypothetical protein
VSELRLICRTGTAEALYRTTTGGWIPVGINARIAFVAATICAIRQVQVHTGLKIDF